MSATIVSNEIIFFNPYPISSHERCDTEDFDEKGEEEVLHCTYIGKLFIMSMAFDKNISDSSYDCTDHKNGINFFMRLVKWPKTEVKKCQNLIFKVDFQLQKSFESF